MCSAMDVDPMPTPAAAGGLSANASANPVAGSRSSVPTEPIPLQTLSKRHLFAIEYPGRIRTPARDAEGCALPSSGPSGLERALATLSPEPPPLSNPKTALQRIAMLVDQQATVLECRLGAPYYPPQAGAPPSLDASMFRSPLLGAILPTNNPVLRIRRRRWRRKLHEGRSKDEVVKEYTTDFVGSSLETVRFRAMADYVYDPPVGSVSLGRQSVVQANVAEGLPRAPPFWDAKGQAEQDPSYTPADLLDDPHDTVLLRRHPRAEGRDASQTMRLLAALTTMNSEAMRVFKFDPEMQEYQAPGDESGKSLLRLVPPPRFTDQNPPFPYFYKQPSNSIIVEKVRPDGSVVRRWENQSGYRGFAPIPWRFASQSSKVSDAGAPLISVSKEPVPTGPAAVVEAERSAARTGVLAHLENLFEEQPLWSRPALLAALAAQTGPVQVKRNGKKEEMGIEPGNEYGLRLQRLVATSKLYLPLMCYTITDSPWRDVLVRFGFDVRKDPAARFSQRIGFRPTGRKGYAKSRKLTYAYGANEREPVRKGKRRQVTDVLPDADEAEDDGATLDGPNDDEDGVDLQSHIFDGQHVGRNATSFLVRDVTDPDLQVLIQDAGPDAVRSSPDVATGWYTEYQWELIREVLGTKYRKLVEDQRPATDWDLRSTVKAVRTRFRRAGLPIPSLASSRLFALDAAEMDEQDEEAILDEPDLEQSFVRAQALVSGAPTSTRRHRTVREGFHVSWQ